MKYMFDANSEMSIICLLELTNPDNKVFPKIEITSYSKTYSVLTSSVS